MDTAVKIENLSKKYLISHQHETEKTTFRQQLLSGFGRFSSAKRVQETQQEVFWALKDVSLEIKFGEVFGIIGRNGAGKSTLLKILSRITEPTEGSATIYGKVGALLEVGTGFHPELTGRENIYLNGTLLGLKKREIDKLFDSIVAFAETEKFLDTPVKRYSSGMYVRLAFAVAAHLNPDVLIVDEVLAVGDAAFQKKCIGQMSRVAKDGRTVIVVTHSMALAEALTSRCAWLQDGSVRALGPSKEVASEYLKHSQTVKIGVSEGLDNYKLRRGPGQVRMCSFSAYDQSGQLTPVFRRGEKVTFKMTIKVLKECRELCLAIAFKLGISGEHLVRTPSLAISESPLAAAQEIDCILQVDTEQIPAGLYDLYIWLGPIKAETFDEFYDILDGLVTPIEILEDLSAGPSRTQIASTLKVEAIRPDPSAADTSDL
jgi:lipopolysaccharide transport system ATP-binding protein